MNTKTLAETQYEIGSRLGNGDLAGAARAAADCRTTWPEESAGWLLGSVIALLSDEKSAALDLAQAWLGNNLDDVDARLQVAECLLALGEREQALAAAASAAANAGNSPARLDTAAQFFIQAGDHARALGLYDRLVEMLPDQPAPLAARAAIQRALGNFPEAATDYQRVLALKPGDPEALKGLTEFEPASTRQSSIASMHDALAAAASGSRDAATLHFGLAKSYADVGDHAASWRELRAGNSLERARLRYNRNTDRAFIDRLIAAFPSPPPAEPDSTGARPIFIVGLPRTGTTLVERILGSHSQVHSAGELAALSEALTVTANADPLQAPRTWLEYAERLNRIEGPTIAAEYLERSRPWRGDRPRMSDKQPANFLYCPLIKRAFPQSAIVHLTRHPLATCYAIYKTQFDGVYPFAYDLDELADFYVAYRRLMSHWHQILPGQIVDVAYEDLVLNQETTTRRLLDGIGLPFEIACLDFHLNAAGSVTASAVQVRQPLYDSSLEAWRHYEIELAPVRARLEAAGISIDNG